MRLRRFALLPLVWAISASGAEPKVDALFAAYDKPDSPGCALGVVKQGALVYKRGYGMADLHHDIPITANSVFHVASLSKQFTAAAIVLLAIDGKLTLDDPVKKHLPEFPEFAAGPVTLRHLIHHTSGLRDQWMLLILSGWRLGEDVVRDEDVMHLVNRQRDLNFAPGAEMLYSNTGYTVLAQVVKRVSGKSLREFTTERIFTPLVMKQTFFRDNHREVVKGLAFGFLQRMSGGFGQADPDFDTTGASSLMTTVEDMARWDAELRLPKVGDRWRSQMEEPFTLTNGEKTAYRFGLISGTHRGRKVLEHSGGDAGYRAHLLQYRDHDLSVICLCNTSANPGALARKTAEAFFGDAPEATPVKRPAVTLQTSQLAPHAGLYWNPKDEEIYRVALRDGQLQLHFGPDDHKLEALDGSTFRSGGIEMRFNNSGALLKLPGRRAERLEKKEEFQPDAKALASFAGNYYSPELDVTYRLVVKDGKMQLDRPKLRTHSVEPTFADAFYARFLGFLRFERDRTGRPAALRLTSERFRHIRFERRP